MVEEKFANQSPHIHAIIYRSDDQDGYVAECWEISVVTQGRTLDEVTANLSEAVALHLEAEDPHIFGLTAQPTIHLEIRQNDRPST